MNMLVRSLKRLVLNRQLNKVRAELAASRDYLAETEAAYHEDHAQELVHSIVKVRKEVVVLESTRTKLEQEQIALDFCRTPGDSRSWSCLSSSV